MLFSLPNFSAKKRKKERKSLFQYVKFSHVGRQIFAIALMSVNNET